MATTATGIVPDPRPEGQTPQGELMPMALRPPCDAPVPSRLLVACPKPMRGPQSEEYQPAAQASMMPGSGTSPVRTSAIASFDVTSMRT